MATLYNNQYFLKWMVRVRSCYLNSSVIFYNLIDPKTGTNLWLVMLVHTYNNPLIFWRDEFVSSSSNLNTLFRKNEIRIDTNINWRTLFWHNTNSSLKSIYKKIFYIWKGDFQDRCWQSKGWTNYFGSKFCWKQI